MGGDPPAGPSEERQRRDASFAGAERATLRAGLALTPSERLAWIEEQLDFLASAGVLKPRELPPGWEDPAPPEAVPRAPVPGRDDRPARPAADAPAQH